MTGTSAKPRWRSVCVQSEMVLIDVGNAEATPNAAPAFLSNGLKLHEPRLNVGRAPAEINDEIGTDVRNIHLASHDIQQTATRRAILDIKQALVFELCHEF